MKHAKLAALTLLAAIVIAGATALANDVVTIYPSAATGELDVTSSADVADLGSSDYAGRVFPVGHKQNLTVGASFSIPSANCVLGVVRGTFNDGTFKPLRWAPVSFATITADSTFTVNGRYVGSSAVLDTSNCEACFIFVKSISSGSVLAGWSLH